MEPGASQLGAQQDFYHTIRGFRRAIHTPNRTDSALAPDSGFRLPASGLRPPSSASRRTDSSRRSRAKAEASRRRVRVHLPSKPPKKIK
jgi:hypothetical protein